jgi:hypothetical protein
MIAIPGRGLTVSRTVEKDFFTKEPMGIIKYDIMRATVFHEPGYTRRGFFLL